MSRDELASRVNAWLLENAREVFTLDERAIGRWERGAVKQPSAHYRAALRSVLGVEHDWELGFGERPNSVSDSNGRQPPTVEQIRAMASSIHVLDRQSGGGALYLGVVTYLQSEVSRALFAPESTAEVFAAAASLTEIAGWMAHDGGRDADARHHFDGSYRLSLAAESATLAANMCASMAHLACELGQVDDAVRIAQVGLDRIGQTGDVARVKSRLYAMRAKGRAMTDDRVGCLEDLDRAERALGGSNDNEHVVWTAHFDEGSLAAETASALHRLGDLGAAEHHAEQVLTLRRGDRIRALAFGQLTMASVVMDAGRLDEATVHARSVCDLAPTLTSARVHTRLRDLAVQVRGRGNNGETTALLDAVDELRAIRPTSAQSSWPV